MKANKFLLPLLLTGIFLFTSCDSTEDPEFEEVVAVANRASGSVSFIDAKSNTVLSTLDIPNSEPMYVVYVESTDKVYVGDRANNRVHVIDPGTRTVDQAIEVGNGVFHMWVGGNGKQLWVNNDIDKTTSVINLETNAVMSTINLGEKPHDVFVNNAGTRAYISILREDSLADQIFMYSTDSFEKMGTQDVGKDPHLFHLASSNKLYVPCQSGQVYVLDGNDLSELSNNDYEGAHGIFGFPNQSALVVANISGAELYAIDSSSDTQIGSDVASSNPVPHNITINEAGNRIFVTHSGGTANTLSVYDYTSNTIAENGIVTIENNPFGLAYYKRRTN